MRSSCLYLLIPVIIIVAGFNTVVTEANSPQLSGDLEIGDRVYTDQTPARVEILDKYYYKKLWLKYKKKFSGKGYYYVKGQYYLKDYETKITYNSKTLDLWFNYTTQVGDKLRRRWKINIKDKNYSTSPIKSYNSYRIKYQIDYDYNEKHEYGVYLQRQWNDYLKNDNKDSTRDKLSFGWDYEINDRLELNASCQFQNQSYNLFSDSSNKYGKKFSIGFNYDL